MNKRNRLVLYAMAVVAFVVALSAVVFRAKDAGHVEAAPPPPGSVLPTDDITVAFTDTEFLDYVYVLAGKTAPAPILYSDVSGVTSVTVYNTSIANLSGIEYFAALTYLSCYNNQLTALDVSNNTALTDLDCSFNRIATLNISSNAARRY